MNMKLCAITAYIITLSLSGCALTTDRIDLRYVPQQQVMKIPGANEISVAVSVNDQRLDKSRVSSKKNGFGMEMAPILATEDVALTVQKAIEQELRARGFQMDKSASAIQISANLMRFYSNHKQGFFAGDAVADLSMSVSVKSLTGDSLYARQITAEGIEPNIQLATGENAKLALDRALQQAMKILFDDRAFLTALMTR